MQSLINIFQSQSLQTRRTIHTLLLAITLLLAACNRSSSQSEVESIAPPELPPRTCDDSPFMWPVEDGVVKWLFRDPDVCFGCIRELSHQGIDIYSSDPNAQLDTVPVYAVADGKLTRLNNWAVRLEVQVDSGYFDTLNQYPAHRPEDKRDFSTSLSTVYAYYTHMANKDGSISYIDERYPLNEEVEVQQGDLIGNMGMKGLSDLENMHLHLSINEYREDNSACNYLTSEDQCRNAHSYDPTPYFGMELHHKDSREESVDISGGIRHICNYQSRSLVDRLIPDVYAMETSEYPISNVEEPLSIACDFASAIQSTNVEKVNEILANEPEFRIDWNTYRMSLPRDQVNKLISNGDLNIQGWLADYPRPGIFSIVTSGWEEMINSGVGLVQLERDSLGDWKWKYLQGVSPEDQSMQATFDHRNELSCYQMDSADNAVHIQENQPIKPIAAIKDDPRSALVVGQYLYSLSREGQLDIFRIPNLSPTQTFRAYEMPEVKRLNLLNGRGLLWVGDYLYAYGTSGIEVLDVSDNRSPQIVAREYGFTVNGLVIHDDYLITGGYGEINVLSVTTPSRPINISKYPIDPEWSVFSLAASDSKIYASEFVIREEDSHRFRIIDFSDPLQLSTIGFIETYDDASYHLYVSGDFLIDCSTNYTTLWDISNSENPSFVESISSSARVCVFDGSTIYNNGSVIEFGAGELVLANYFDPGSSQGDGFPYIGDFTDEYVFLPQAGQILILARK